MSFDRAHGIHVPMTPNMRIVKDLLKCQLAKTTPFINTSAAYSLYQNWQALARGFPLMLLPDGSLDSGDVLPIRILCDFERDITNSSAETHLLIQAIMLQWSVKAKPMKWKVQMIQIEGTNVTLFVCSFAHFQVMQISCYLFCIHMMCLVGRSFKHRHMYSVSVGPI